MTTTASAQNTTTRLPGRDRKGTCGTCGASKRQAHTSNCRRYELDDPAKTAEFHGIEGRVDRFSIRAAMDRNGCTCPGDCNCRSEFRTTYCGCKAHR